MSTRKEEALILAEELLSDIELKRIDPMDIARKASRLARLTDDTEAMQWLSYEIAGFSHKPGDLDKDASKAGRRSNRYFQNDNEEHKYYTAGIGQIQASIDTAILQLSSKAGTPDAMNLRKQVVDSRGLLDKIIGAFHGYAITKYEELRFGDAVETIFESFRSHVDNDLGKLVPEALPILSTALENLSDDNPIQWKNAAQACRDLIKAAADALRPPSKPKNGISMSESNYINRLIDWVQTTSESQSSIKIFTSDLSDLGNRIDAVTNGGNKGAHAKVTRLETSRLIIGTYMLLGDILSLSENNKEVEQK